MYSCCVQDKDKGPPLIVQKSDGGFGYATTDMAAIRQRLHDEKGEWLIYVTDMGQAPHFEAIFAGKLIASSLKARKWPICQSHLQLTWKDVVT